MKCWQLACIQTLTIMRQRRFPKIPNQPREGGNEI